MKRCRVCHQNKLVEEFPIRTAYRDGRDTQCRICATKYKSGWRAANPDRAQAANKRYYENNRELLKKKSRIKRDPIKQKAAVLKRTYGITLEDYQQMLEKQNHVCAICKRPETRVSYGKLRALSVDHNHATGKIRRLLCNICNRVIGLVEEDPVLLQNMISYLQEHA